MKESKLHMVLTALIDIIWLGILWLVCSLPVITIGAASTALYYTMVKCVRHDIPEPTRFFFRAFRKNFRQATLLWLLCLAALGVGLLDIVAFSQMGVKRGDFLYIFSRLLLLPVPMLFPWIFAFLSRFENTVTGTLRFAVWLALKNWKQTLLMFFEAALVGLICWLLPQIAPLMPGVLCLLTSFSIEPALRELSAGQGRPDDWYNE
ncbi:MAG: YesL family protein [Oscillospiraceae bacterium]|nr:YesL family protein [Oscillospiraceae bacterium]